MSRYILDTRLSYYHYVVCTEAIRKGVITPNDLNEGRRTMGEQWYFWRNQPPLAAFPSPNAPHIWKGRPHHAIDSNSWNGATRRLAAFYESHGIDVIYNARGENWHWQPVSAAQLRAAAKKILRERDLMVSKVGETEPRINFFKFQLHFIKNKNGNRYFPHHRPDDGYSDRFTTELEKAVKRFQLDHGLKADGVIGPVTDRRIDRVFAKQKRNRRSARERAVERKMRFLRGEAL